MAFGGRNVAVAYAQAESWIVSEAEIDAWLERARHREELVYARAVRLPRCAPAAVRVRVLVERGLVDAYHRRLGPDATHYCVRRRSVRLPSMPPPVVRLVPPRIDGGAARIFALLRFAAEHGAICPTNAKMARWAGLRRPEDVTERLKRLEAREMIRIERPAPGERIVTILASGISTAMPPWLAGSAAK